MSASQLTRHAIQAGRAAAPGRRALGEVVATCHAHEATLWVISRDGLAMEGALNHGATPQILENVSVPLDASVVGMVASNGLSASIGADHYRHPGPEREGGATVQAMIAAPVYVRQKIVGVLSAIKSACGDLFTPDDLEALNRAADLMGKLLADTDEG